MITKLIMHMGILVVRSDGVVIWIPLSDYRVDDSLTVMLLLRSLGSNGIGLILCVDCLIDVGFII
jgi:hypothetical protein